MQRDVYPALLRGLLAMAALRGAHAADDASRAPSLGPFRPGMSFEAARAASPALAWDEMASQIDAEYPKVLAAPDAVRIGALDFGVQLKQGRYGAGALIAWRRGTTRNARACERSYADTLAALESTFGASRPTNERYANESVFVTMGKPTLTETRGAGGESNYTHHETATYSESTAVLPVAGGELATVGQYFVHSPLYGDSACHLSIRLETRGQSPGEEDEDR